ncbi:hypothetical protein ElyMa_006739600 [Elysia marginata]|uniref:Uncharacterized protein n=1 Tax=Elysia marginata TaxID=1093978 RepID=A0AAV4IUF8_9GAST|nr:hypothetical protein ElyMa_006739600 [Elysia marginata]
MTAMSQPRLPSLPKLKNLLFLSYGLAVQVAIVAGLVSLVLHCVRSDPPSVGLIVCLAPAGPLTICLVAAQIYFSSFSRHGGVKHDRVYTILGVGMTLTVASVVAPLHHDRDGQVLAGQIASILGYLLSAVIYALSTLDSFRMGTRQPAVYMATTVLGGVLPVVHVQLPAYSKTATQEDGPCKPPAHSPACHVRDGTCEANPLGEHEMLTPGSSPPPPYSLLAI